MDILKTVKMYVGGEFIRSESGRTEAFIGANGKEYARYNQASKKDFRNAVEKAKSAVGSWAGKTAYNRSQILYRMAEMAQTKKSEIESVLIDALGVNSKDASNQVQAAIDTFVYYAGFCDKYQQVLGAVNPVSSPYHNFTTPEPMGVVVLIDDKKFNLVQFIDNICAILVGSNSVVAMISEECPVIVSTLGEVFATSDLPAGVVNILSGQLNELATTIATHMEVKAISYQNSDEATYFKMRADSVDNMKRIFPKTNKTKSLDKILDAVEFKTVWHPIELSDGSAVKY